MKRLQQAKALKQKVNKQLEALGRRNLRDVRIVRKDMVYVTGMKMTGDRDEVSLMMTRVVLKGELRTDGVMVWTNAGMVE